MFEYKVEKYRVRDAEEAINKLAQLGWKVFSVMPDIAAGYGIIVVFERKI